MNLRALLVHYKNRHGQRCYKSKEYFCFLRSKWAHSQHRTKLQESVNGNVEKPFWKTRRITCVSVTGFVTFSRVSVAAYTTEPDHFYVNITETWSCMFPPRFRNTETCDFVLCKLSEKGRNLCTNCLADETFNWSLSVWLA